MHKAIKLLDHGFIRLIDSMGNDLSIVRNARISHDAAWRESGEQNDHKLINYLMKNRHTTPFECVCMTFEVKAPIFVFRQWHRHRTQSYNEQSARYTELIEEFYVPRPEDIGVQSLVDHQSREISKEFEAGIAVNVVSEAMYVHNEKTFALYKDLLASGVPRELARSVLPVSTYSHMFATVNLHNLFHFLSLRMSDHAQYEIRVYANEMFRIAYQICPVAVQAFWEHTLDKSLGELIEFMGPYSDVEENLETQQ